MQELITAYEDKIAAMQLVIDTQNKTIADLHSFLVNMGKEICPAVERGVKKQAALSIKIEELKLKVNNQTVEISDQDAKELGITPDTSNDDDDYGTPDTSNDDDDYGTPDTSNDDDDYGTPDTSNDDDDYGI